MNTFICWSQSRSRQLAEALHSWLPQVLPGENFFLSSDIEKSALWFEAIRNQLKKADAAIRQKRATRADAEEYSPTCAALPPIDASGFPAVSSCVRAQLHAGEPQQE
jgi:hypothetical protein